jgi:hypothetical protein
MYGSRVSLIGFQCIQVPKNLNHGEREREGERDREREAHNHFNGIIENNKYHLCIVSLQVYPSTYVHIKHVANAPIIRSDNSANINL